MKGFRDFIPLWGLLDSSSSALRGNPPNEHGLARIDIGLDKLVHICCGELCGVGPVVGWINGAGCASQDAAEKQAEGCHPLLGQKPKATER